jgi:hypothetical protein
MGITTVRKQHNIFLVIGICNFKLPAILYRYIIFMRSWTLADKVVRFIQKGLKGCLPNINADMMKSGYICSNMINCSSRVVYTLRMCKSSPLQKLLIQTRGIITFDLLRAMKEIIDERYFPFWQQLVSNAIEINSRTTCRNIWIWICGLLIGQSTCCYSNIQK